MTTSTNQRQLNTIVGLFVATFFLATIQTLCFIVDIRDAVTGLQTGASIFLPTSLPLYVLYFLVPTFGCALASLIFHPKRIISSVYVQITSVSILTLMVTYRVATTLLNNPIPQLNNQVFQNLLITLVVSYIFAFTLGLVETMFVRWFVGLSEESVDKKSFLVDEVPEKVMKILESSLRDSHHFEIERVAQRCWILKKTDEWSNSVVIAIGQDPKDKDKSIFATVAFYVGRYGIKKDNQATETRESIINDLKIRLETSKLTLKPIEETENEISKMAYNEAKIVTKSKIEIARELFGRVPRPYRNILYFMVSAYILITLAYVARVGNLDFNTYVILSATFVLAIAVDIGIPLAEKLHLRRNRRRRF